MDDGLRARFKPDVDHIGVKISKQKCDLEEQYAGSEGGRCTAEPWQNIFRDDELDLK